jgi:hypothetical protein
LADLSALVRAPEKAARCFQAEGEENSFAWLTAAAALGAAAGDHGQMAGNADCEGRTLNSSLFRSRLLCIIRWETTIRASIAELAVKTFKPSDANVTIK